MSENDRMERAKRIRQMREGARTNGDEQADETDDEGQSSGATAEAPADADETEPADSAVEPSTTGVTDDTGGSDDADAADDTGAEADAGGAEGADSERTDTETVPEAVESISGTRADLPSTEEMEAAMEQTIEQAESVGDSPGVATESPAEAAAETTATDSSQEATTTQTEETRVLEFTLADEQYCLDIQYIEEIVKNEHITRVPNTPAFVEGVVDLRGQITTILNPKIAIGKDDRSAGDLIVVFDAESFDDQGHIGWVVDDVRQVSPISEDQVNEPPIGEDYINGVVDREDGEFVIWTTPDLALDEAE